MISLLCPCFSIPDLEYTSSYFDWGSKANVYIYKSPSYGVRVNLGFGQGHTRYPLSFEGALSVFQSEVSNLTSLYPNDTLLSSSSGSYKSMFEYIYHSTFLKSDGFPQFVIGVRRLYLNHPTLEKLDIDSSNFHQYYNRCCDCSF